ncbi:MAG: hypothetical protein ACRBCK_01455 [Alphaproteobacteria bacterium]
MFDEAFTKLDINEIASILDTVNQNVEGSIFDPLETTVMAIDVPFYPNYRFLNIADHATNPPLQRFVFQKNDTLDFTIIDWMHKTIYELNSEAPVQLDDNNIIEYVRFFFSYVKGRHGRFNICESADNIQWKEEPNAEVRKALNQTLKPLNKTDKSKTGIYTIAGFMMLKDTLFSVNIYVEPNGTVSMADHEIIIEGVPVLDPTFGQ